MCLLMEAVYFAREVIGVGERLRLHRRGEECRLPDGGAMCRMLEAYKNGYYVWRSRPPSERKRQDALLTEKVCEIQSSSRETYDYPTVHTELRSLGIGCGRWRVARLMKAAELRGCMRGKKRRTTRRGTWAAPAPDLHFARTSWLVSPIEYG